MESNNKKGFDMEAGISNQLYPMMQELPQLRWAFIRKVYIILAMQLLLTVGVAATVVFVPPIPRFILHTTPGLAIYIVSLILTLIRMSFFLLVSLSIFCLYGFYLFGFFFCRIISVIFY